MKYVSYALLCALIPVGAQGMESGSLISVVFKTYGNKGKAVHNTTSSVDVPDKSTLADAIDQYLRTNSIPADVMLRVKLKNSAEFQERDWNKMILHRRSDRNMVLLNVMNMYQTPINAQNPIEIYFIDAQTAIPLTGARR